MDDFHKSVEELFKNLNEAFKNTIFSFTTQYAYSKDWHRIFVVRDGNGVLVQIGRITLERKGDNAEIYYIKSYKPFNYPFEFEEDKVWSMLRFYFKKGKLPSKRLMKQILLMVQTIRDLKIVEIKKYRDEHPTKKKRKKIVGKNIGLLFAEQMLALSQLPPKNLTMMGAFSQSL